MFSYFYLSTLDRKKNAHSYKLPAGEAAPVGHEITDLRIAGQWSLADLLPLEQAAALAVAFPQRGRKSKGRKGNAPWTETKAKMRRVAEAS